MYSLSNASGLTGLGFAAFVQDCGTERLPIEVQPRTCATHGWQTPPGCDTSNIIAAALFNADALLRELRWAIAKSVAPHSELSFDRGDATDERQASSVVVGDRENAFSASGITGIT